LLFLKAFEDIEDSYEETSHDLKYKRVIEGPYRWSVWTGSRRKSAEVEVVEAQQIVNKCSISLDRARERLESLRQGKDPDIKNGKVLKPIMFDSEKTANAEQQLEFTEAAMSEAQASLENAKENLAKAIVWLEEQVKPLYEEQAVEQRVLHAIKGQFNGRLVLEQEQLNLLRENERQQGQDLANKLVNGLSDVDLLDFVDHQLFPFLRHLQGSPQQNTISSIFNEMPGNRIRSAHNFKAVIDLIDEVSFKSQEDTQIVSQVYEDLLSRLGTESGIAGEFYTPRHIIRFMIQGINPLIGEMRLTRFCGDPK
jgi:type I restriction-modification system DNA methylase subunit